MVTSVLTKLELNNCMYWQNPNNVVLGGHLTYDPILKDTKSSSGAKVVDFSIGNNLKSTTAPSKAHFFRCEAWGKTAELIHEHFKKGDPITIIGSLHWHAWQDAETGAKRDAVKIRVENFYFPPGGGRKEEGETRSRGAGTQLPPMPGQKPMLYPAADANPADDEIPF